MTLIQKWSSLILVGVLIMLGGLAWDAVIHTQEHAHLVVEALFNPTNPFENPAHLAIAVGLLWTTLITLAAFTQSWLEGKPWRLHRQILALPLALWLFTGALSFVAFITLAKTP